jgi:hypothetical protein
MPDTEETKVREIQCRGVRCRESGMLIPKERGCQYEERRDADVEECDTEAAGMRIPRESNANAKREQCQCRGQMLPGNEAYNSTTISVTG